MGWGKDGRKFGFRSEIRGWRERRSHVSKEAQNGRKTRARCNVCAAMDMNVGARWPRLNHAGATTNVAALFRSVNDSYYNQDCLHSHLTATTRCRDQLKCDGTRAETRFRLSAKRTSPFKSARGVSSVDYWQPKCAHRR